MGMFETIFTEATEAANAAGDEWCKQHKGDACGFAFLQVKDQRTSFAKWLKKNGHLRNDVIVLPHKYRSNQEWTLKEACIMAAWGVFDSHGIKTKIYSRID